MTFLEVWKGAVAVFASAVFILFATGTAVSFAEPLGSDIVCKVFTDLTALGSPIPTLDGGDCPEEQDPPPPPPPPPPRVACTDGVDNDEDGLIDMDDPGCSDSSDTDEIDAAPPPPPSNPQCSDGFDNDNDGKVDAEDPGCAGGASDDDETDYPDEDDDTPPPSPNPNPSPTPTPTPSPSPVPSSGGGGGGSGGGAGLPPGTTLYTSTTTRSAASVGQVLGATAFSKTTESCDRYLTAFIREGKENDADQVRRLQRFLRDFEGVAVSETGIYDKATFAAVRAFQTKYAADILTPWGIKESTGYVYLTTRKKVNEIFCGYTKVFYLTIEEQRRIDEARREAIATGEIAPKLQAPAERSAPKPSSPAETPKPATTTDKGQGVVGRSLRFLREFWNSAR